MNVFRGQASLYTQRKLRWWYYTLPLATLVVALLGTQIRLLVAHAAEKATGNVVEVVKLSKDPYTKSSPALHETGYEPASYAFDSTIVSAFQVGRFLTGGSTNLGWATSTDSGKHWHTGLLRDTTIYAGGSHAAISNATVAYDPKDHIWLISSLLIDNITIGGQTSVVVTEVVVSRSRDGGLTWSTPVVVSADPSGDRNYDKDWMTCDTSIRSPFYGHCYILWNALPAIDLSTSTDGGATWGSVKNSASLFTGTAGELVVQPNGTVVVLTPDDGSGFPPQSPGLVAFTSLDGGQSWGAPVIAAPGNDLSLSFPTLTVDAKGILYAMWGGSADANGDLQTVFMISSPDGVHWTTPRSIFAPEANAAEDHLALAADPEAGGRNAHLGLTYYNNVVLPVPPFTATMQPFFISSTDAGRHWSHPQALSSPQSFGWLVPKRTVGDYISTVFSKGRAFPFFVIGQPRGANDPYHQEVYTVKEGIRY